MQTHNWYGLTMKLKARSISLKLVNSIGLCCLLFLQSFSISANSAVVIDSPAQSQVWQELITQLPKDRGLFNSSLRKGVRQNLSLVDSINLDDNEAIKAQVLPRLELLDASLSKYIRISTSKTSFEQLSLLMPALFAIEEIKLIKALYKQQKISMPQLRNSRLQSHLDKRITRLANGMVFNMKALVRNRPFESELLKAMASNGISFSARPPDFYLDYGVNTVGEDSAQWLIEGYINLSNKWKSPVVEASDEISTAASTLDDAQLQAIAKLALLVTQELKTYLIALK